MPYRRSQSIRYKILAMVVLPVIGLFLLFTWNTQQLLDRFVEESARSTVEKFSQTFNLALSPYTASDETLAEIQPFLAELIGEESTGVVYLTLLDESGNAIASTSNVPSPLPEPDKSFDDLQQRQTLHISRPILLGLSGVGDLHYGISIETIQQAGQRLFQENLRNSAVSLALALALIVGLAALILLRLNSRLNNLLQSSRSITEGHYDLSIEDMGDDEITQLSSQMNTMAASIRARVKELERNEREIRALNADLELRGEELTTTLENLQSTQDNLIQAEKLAGLGSVVAAVAHELNTPVGNALTVASGLTDKTQRFHASVKEGLRKSVLQAYMDDTLTATDILQRSLERAAELIASFKHVAVDQTSSQRRHFMLDTVVNDLMITLRPGINKKNIELQIEIEDELEMNSFPGPLGQVLTNLFNNALLHGFEDRDSGAMTIIGRAIPDDRIELLFRDNGRGMPQETLSRLFDPFFTTKLGRGGSGLGMHIVYNIVTNVLQGSMDVSSTPGQGSEFIMRLPRSPEDASRPQTTEF